MENTIAGATRNGYQVLMQPVMKLSRAARSANRVVSGMILSGLVLFGLLCACSPKADSKLIVGMELSYPPFEMTDERGNPSGVSVDLAKALGKHLGKEIAIQNLPFDGLIPALKTGKIDLIISSMTATAEPAQSID